MKIALFLKNDKIDESDIDTIPIIVLHTDSNTVVEIEKDIIVKKGRQLFGSLVINQANQRGVCNGY